MTTIYGFRMLTVAALSCGVIFAAQNVHSGDTNSTRDRVVLARSLPTMKGDELKITVLEVAYAPGASSSAHSHPCPVVAYVVSGAIRSQVKGESEAVYQVGQSFFEPAKGVHVVSANASKTEPAKFVAYFLCDHETKLSLPPVESRRNETRHGSK